MVANIRSGSSPGGALYYNKEKVDKGEAEVLFRQKMLEPFDRYGRLDIDACMESFRPYLEANRRTINTVFHTSLNPSPVDELTDEQLRTSPASTWSAWVTANSPISFSSIRTFPESIFISYRCGSMRTFGRSATRTNTTVPCPYCGNWSANTGCILRRERIACSGSDCANRTRPNTKYMMRSKDVCPSVRVGTIWKVD